MNLMKIPVDPDSLYQIINFNAKVGRVTRRLRIELRYLYYTDKWYISVFNAQTGESYCRYVPVVTSQVELNDIVTLYKHKDIGWFACVASTDNPSSEDPQMNNIGEFEIYWGDGFD